MKKNDVAAVGIVSLVALECVALITGQDGALFAPIVASVSGIIGYVFGQTRAEKKAVAA